MAYNCVPSQCYYQKMKVYFCIFCNRPIRIHLGVNNFNKDEHEKEPIGVIKTKRKQILVYHEKCMKEYTENNNYGK